MFSYNITWGATKKEVERSNFFIEVPRILKRFWFAFAVAIACFASIVLFSLESVVTADWLIPGNYWAVIFPLALVAGCHVLFPVGVFLSMVMGMLNGWGVDHTEPLVDDILVLIRGDPGRVGWGCSWSRRS